MNGAHWHLVVNHLPLIFPVVGVIVMITALLAKSEPVKRTAFLIFILGALAAITAMYTGEQAEETVEKIRGIGENSMKSHEETAETFALLSYILGGISLLGLWVSFRQKTFSTLLAFGTLLFAIAVLFFARETGTTGGEIRHTEIKSGNDAPPTETGHEENERHE